jgi:hypothetical protein
MTSINAGILMILFADYKDIFVGKRTTHKFRFWYYEAIGIK